ncbi:MAG: DUF3794 domain-containing protein [Desulfotomaculaceae bacterium]
MIFCPNGVLGDGVVQFCPNTDSPAVFFTETIIDGNLIIPAQKPPKQHIVKSSTSVALKDVEVIEVTLPDGTTGNKILVAGIITLGIQYAADVPSQKVHFVHYEIPFEVLVLADCGGLIDPANPIFPDNFVPHVCVEKLRLTQIDNRTISKEIVLLVWIEQVTP